METLAVLAVRVVEVMFATGLLGSAVVVLFTSVEDFEELLGGEHPSERKPEEP